MQVVVIRSGLANMESVCAAVRRSGADPYLTGDSETVSAAEAVIMPGVGAFGTEMNRLREHELADVLRERIFAGRKTLGIALGMQALFSQSDESPGVEGLGVIEGRLRRFENIWPVPQIGWNRVEADSSMRVLSSGWAYFAHSYYAPRVDQSWATAISEHGQSFVAGVERGLVVACQFHPELSGAFGQGVMDRWLGLESD